MLAFIELDRRRPEEALGLLERGRELFGSAATQFDRAKFGLEEARALAQLGQLEEAASLAMGFAGDLGEGDPVEAGRRYLLLAEFDQAGDVARAKELYELAVDLLQETPTTYLAAAYSQLAELLEREGDTDAALDLLKKAVRVQTHFEARTRDEATD